MQEKMFQLHREKMTLIKDSTLNKSKRYEEEHTQEKYLSQLSKHKLEVQERAQNHIKTENQRLFHKLIETEHRDEENPERSLPKKHWNSFFSSKKKKELIQSENYTMIVRMINQEPLVPPLK